MMTVRSQEDPAGLGPRNQPARRPRSPPPRSSRRARQAAPGASPPGGRGSRTARPECPPTRARRRRSRSSPLLHLPPPPPRRFRAPTDPSRRRDAPAADRLRRTGRRQGRMATVSRPRTGGGGRKAPAGEGDGGRLRPTWLPRRREGSQRRPAKYELRRTGRRPSDERPGEERRGEGGDPSGQELEGAGAGDIASGSGRARARRLAPLPARTRGARSGPGRARERAPILSRRAAGSPRASPLGARGRSRLPSSRGVEANRAEEGGGEIRFFASRSAQDLPPSGWREGSASPAGPDPPRWPARPAPRSSGGVATAGSRAPRKGQEQTAPPGTPKRLRRACAVAPPLDWLGGRGLRRRFQRHAAFCWRGRARARARESPSRSGSGVLSVGSAPPLPDRTVAEGGSAARDEGEGPARRRRASARTRPRQRPLPAAPGPEAALAQAGKKGRPGRSFAGGPGGRGGTPGRLPGEFPRRRRARARARPGSRGARAAGEYRSYARAGSSGGIGEAWTDASFLRTGPFRGSPATTSVGSPASGQAVAERTPPTARRVDCGFGLAGFQLCRLFYSVRVQARGEVEQLPCPLALFMTGTVTLVRSVTVI
jgi:hypothetical protein